MRKTHVINCCLVLLCLLWPLSLGAAAEGAWQTVETQHALVRYQNPQDLERFDKKIDYEPGRSGLKWIFGNKQDGNTADRATRKVDAIYARAQEILEMHKKSPRKVRINLYADQNQLHAAYQKIYRKKTRLRAWYIFEYNTIYLNVRDLHEGILAHELAHSIIDNYLTTRPPHATAEILARYVDKHLIF